MSVVDRRVHEVAAVVRSSVTNPSVRRAAAVFEMIAGALALVIVIGGYLSFAPNVRVALHEADGLAVTLNDEIKDAIDVLATINGSVGDVRGALPNATQALASAKDAAGEISKTVDGFGGDCDHLADICKRTSSVCRTFEEQLPLRVPAVNLSTKTVSFNVPEVIPRFKTISVPHPTATAHTGHADVPYPTASVKMGHFGNKWASFDYPEGIDIGTAHRGLDYPDRLDIGTSSISVQVPDTPEFKVNKQSVEVPDKLEVTHRELMKAEKEILQRATVMLDEVSDRLQTAHGQMAKVGVILNTDASISLDKVVMGLKRADGSLRNLNEAQIPGVIKKLTSQIANVTKARGVFQATEGLIPVLGVIATLIPLGMICSGFWKWTNTLVA